MSHGPHVRVQGVPEFWSGSVEEHVRKLAQAVNGILRGKTNNILEVTLAPGATQTEVLADRVTVSTVPIAVPRTASAAATIGLWSESTTGKVILHHDASAATDREFDLVLCG